MLFLQSEEIDTVTDIVDIQKQKALASRGARTSVSAEVFGKYHARGSYTATVINKSEITKDKYF